MSEKHIFISYSRNDGEPYISQLEQRLGAHHRVWRDIRGLRPDQDFTADIERAIEAASHVVVCLTPDIFLAIAVILRGTRFLLWGDYLSNSLVAPNTRSS